MLLVAWEKHEFWADLDEGGIISYRHGYFPQPPFCRPPAASHHPPTTIPRQQAPLRWRRFHVAIGLWEFLFAKGNGACLSLLLAIRFASCMTALATAQGEAWFQTRQWNGNGCPSSEAHHPPTHPTLTHRRTTSDRPSQVSYVPADSHAKPKTLVISCAVARLRSLRERPSQPPSHSPAP